MEERLDMEVRPGGRVLSGVMFSPRGGSAHVTRALLGQLGRYGWSLRLVAGSRSDLGGDADSRLFYDGLELFPVNFSRALTESDPVNPADPEIFPMHPSFEQRPDAPDRVFASLDDLEFQRQVRAWSTELDRAGAAEADVLYLQHLTPLNEAAAQVAPAVPVVGHLHGTELLMLEQIEQGPPTGWEFAEQWAARMRRWAVACERLIVSPAGLERAHALLGVTWEKLVPLANGFDPEVFRPLEIDRLAHWRRHLVERPAAHAPDGGKISYDEGEIEVLGEGVVLLYVGRFTEVKRLPFLLEAFAAAQPRFERPAALAIVGGHPGEWEGEHPADTVRRLGLQNVFLAGWQRQHALPAFLNAADAIILPSAREQFGQTLVEGMACGCPGVAANALGPSRILSDGETGWLFEPDEREGLERALCEAVNDPAERRRRGALAREAVLHRLSWPMLARRLDETLTEAAGLGVPAAPEPERAGAASTMGSDE
jgi:glycosyltransferase involved in cell wall biosynthesis